MSGPSRDLRDEPLTGSLTAPPTAPPTDPFATPRHEPRAEHREAIALLAAEAERARGGAGRLVLLRGATGTGRTTVLEAAAEDAAAHGMRVLRARCSAEDTAVPFTTVLQLLGPVPGYPPTPEELDERAQSEPLWRILRAYATDSPLFVAVDDVHLADAASRRWLVESARHVSRLPLPLLLAVTERSQYDIEPPAAGFTRTLSPALVHAHTLAPLTAESATELVRAEFPDTDSPQLITNCVRAGAGNPLLLRALLDDLGGDGRHPGAPENVPETSAALYPGAYPQAVAWWLDSAGPVTTEVARTLAVLDEGWDGLTPGMERRLSTDAECPVGDLSALIGELTNADPARVSGWLTAMTGLGLLLLDPFGRPRYAHGLLRDAVLTGVPAARRRAAHRAVAEALLRRGAPTEEVARKLLAAEGADPADTDELGLPSWAFAILREAAGVALREGRAGDAVAYLRSALREPMDEERRQRLLTELGSLEFTAQGSAAGIPRLSEALRLAGQPQDRVRAAMALGTALAGRGKARAAVQVLREVNSQLSGHPDLLRTLQTASALLSEEDQVVKREVYRLATDTAERSPELLGTAGQSLLVRYAATAGLSTAEDAMRRIRTLLAEPADPLSEPFLVGTAAAIAQWADELDEAQRLVERGLTGLRPDLLHPMRRALLNTRDDITAAREDRTSLLSNAEIRLPIPPGDTPGNRHAHVLISLVETGQLAEAQRFSDSFDLQDAPDNWEFNRFLYARGVLRATCDDPAGALHDFLECGRRQSAREVHTPVVTPWRTAAAWCQLMLGSPQEALALAEEELRLARLWNTPRTVGRALSALAAATGGRRGLELAEEAVRLLRTSPAGTELGRALVRQGRALTAAGERARARDSLREAAELAERTGSVRVRTQAEEALREGGARRTTSAHTGSHALTGSERRIAELAANGRTNVEIADLLHVARRTVETHLTSTYRKLGIRKRGELAEVLGRET